MSGVVEIDAGEVAGDKVDELTSLVFKLLFHQGTVDFLFEENWEFRLGLTRFFWIDG